MLLLYFYSRFQSIQTWTARSGMKAGHSPELVQYSFFTIDFIGTNKRGVANGPSYFPLSVVLTGGWKWAVAWLPW